MLFFRIFYSPKNPENNALISIKIHYTDYGNLSMKSAH